MIVASSIHHNEKCNNRMKKIVFATNNKHKLDEIHIITDGSLQILGLADIHCEDEIEETGTTLEENALLKAR